MKCPKCGYDTPDDSVFCEHCGTMLKGEESKKSRNRVYFWIGLIVVIISLVSYLYYSGNSKASLRQNDFYVPTQEKVRDALSDTVSVPLKDVNIISLTNNSRDNNTEKMKKEELKEKINPTTESTSKTNITGIFSISPSKKVIFSSGNLQYKASTNEWRFAPHQWDIIGNANKNISSTYDGWIDLFGWGTSGYGGKHPYMNSSNEKDYVEKNTDIAGTCYDWGVYNQIGETSADTWRTLTVDEWEFILTERANASLLLGKATINGVEGLVLLPDNWNFSKGLSFTHGKTKAFTTNLYSNPKWFQMEKEGAVFLPVTKYRRKSAIYEAKWGGYWSSSSCGELGACYLQFRDDDVIIFARDFYYGQAVRLVKDM